MKLLDYSKQLVLAREIIAILQLRCDNGSSMRKCYTTKSQYSFRRFYKKIKIWVLLKTQRNFIYRLLCAWFPNTRLDNFQLPFQGTLKSYCWSIGFIYLSIIDTLSFAIVFFIMTAWICWLTTEIFRRLIYLYDLFI